MNKTRKTVRKRNGKRSGKRNGKLMGKHTSRKHSKSRKVYKKRMQKGGVGFIPQDLHNVGRGLVHNTKSLWNSYKGVETIPSPFPMVEHPISANVKIINTSTPDVIGIRNNAVKFVTQ